MIKIDVRNGIVEISGSTPNICADFVKGLKELYDILAKDCDKEYADKVLNEIFRGVKLSDEDMKKEVDEKKKELLDRIFKQTDMLNKLSEILSKTGGNTSKDNTTDTFDNIFKDIIDEMKEDK